MRTASEQKHSAQRPFGGFDENYSSESEYGKLLHDVRCCFVVIGITALLAAIPPIVSVALLW